MRAVWSKNKAHEAAGFTLIELIVVLTLIAILLTIAVPRYFKVVDSGKLRVQHQNIAVMRDALDKYNGDQGRYPDRLQDLVDKRYLREIPVDPVSESTEWIVLAPPAERAGAVYDVQAPAAPNAEAAPPRPPASQVTPVAFDSPEVAPALTSTTVGEGQ